MLYAGLDFAAMPCCDLDPHHSDPNIACDPASQNGDHFCEIV